MKKPINIFLLLIITCTAWAEKYEYVRLKMTNPLENEDTRMDFGDSIVLESGDVAKIVAVRSHSADSLVLWDGEDYIEFDTKYTSSGETTPSPNLIVGPGTLFLADFYGNSAKSVTIAIQRASETGSKTLSWNGTEWERSSDDTQQANSNSLDLFDPKNIKYDEFLGWVWFTNTNWVYSYKNLSWYYMHPTNAGIMVWNANLPDDGWLKLDRG